MNGMRTIVVLCILIATGWAIAEKNRSDGYMPNSIQCVTPTDSGCVGTARAGLRVPIGDINLKGLANSLMGRCELEVEGRGKSEPCANVQLVLESEREGEQKTAVMDGFNFRFDQIAKQKYRLTADSEKYTLSPSKMITEKNGNQITIKLKAKPKQ